jgi:hypothetical protein
MVRGVGQWDLDSNSHWSLFALVPEFNARQARTRIVRSPPIAQSLLAPPSTNRRQESIYAGSFQKRNSSHIASRRKGMQLLPSFKSKKKFQFKGGTAWLGNQTY